MANPKAQTLQQRFGFMDEDLKTSNHDDIMIWLNDHIENIVKKISGRPDKWNPDKVGELRSNARRLVDDAIADTQQRLINGPLYDSYGNTMDERLLFYKSWNGLGEPPERPPLEIETIWEYAIKSDKFIIGFVDMKASYWVDSLELCGVEKDSRGNITRASFRDLPAFEINQYYNEYTVCFEVKTTIPSLGELIRQIHMYKEYQHGKFYVVSSEDKFIEQLKSQNIGFVKYPTGEIFKP